MKKRVLSLGSGSNCPFMVHLANSGHDAQSREQCFIVGSNAKSCGHTNPIWPRPKPQQTLYSEQLLFCANFPISVHVLMDAVLVISAFEKMPFPIPKPNPRPGRSFFIGSGDRSMGTMKPSRDADKFPANGRDSSLKSGGCCDCACWMMGFGGAINGFTSTFATDVMTTENSSIRFASVSAPLDVRWLHSYVRRKNVWESSGRIVRLDTCRQLFRFIETKPLSGWLHVSATYEQKIVRLWKKKIG